MAAENEIKLEYKGKIIRFNEPDNVWVCGELELRNPKLSVLKRRIDEFDKDERTVNVKALRYARRDYFTKLISIDEVTITTLADDGKQCWIRDEKGERHKVYVHGLVAPEHRAQLEEWGKIEIEANALTKQADKLLDAVPKLNADLVKAMASK